MSLAWMFAPRSGRIATIEVTLWMPFAFCSLYWLYASLYEGEPQGSHAVRSA
jgi:hypothetical protein